MKIPCLVNLWQSNLKGLLSSFWDYFKIMNFSNSPDEVQKSDKPNKQKTYRHVNENSSAFMSKFQLKSVSR